MVDYQNKKGSKVNVPSGAGHKGAVIDSNIEGRPSEVSTIRGSGRVGGKKGAGNVGSTNVNAA